MSIRVLESGLVSQRVISEEIGKIQAGAAAGETQPRLDFAPYRSAGTGGNPVPELPGAHPMTGRGAICASALEAVAGIAGGAAGAGIGAFFTPTGFGTPLGEGKETVDGTLRAAS